MSQSTDPQPAPSPAGNPPPLDHHELLRLVMRTNTLALVVINRDGTILQNKGGALLTMGYRCNELVGRSIYDLARDLPQIQQDFQRALAGAAISTMSEVRGGSFHIRYTPITDRDNALTSVVMTALDVTELTTAERALDESQRRLQTIAENIPGVVYRMVYRPDGSFTIPYLSGALLATFDCAAEQLILEPQQAARFIHPDDLHAYTRARLHARHTLKPLDHEFRVYAPNGQVRWLKDIASAFVTPAGEVVIDGVVLDVTDRKHSQLAFQQVHEELEHRVEARTAELEAMLAASPDVQFRLKPDGAFKAIYTNDTQSLLYPAQRYTGLHPRDMLPAHVAQLIEQSRHQVRLTHAMETFEFTMTIEGQTRFYETRLAPLPRHETLGIIRDMTEQKRAEQAVRESEQAQVQFQTQLTALHEVTNDLFKTDTVDDLCRRAVELGRTHLGFDRLGIWFYSSDRLAMRGSYGTDEKGLVRDERDWLAAVPDDVLLSSLPDEYNRLIYDPERVLRANVNQHVGRGEWAAAALWDGYQIAGFMCTDNQLTGKPITVRQRELLMLYASAVGHLCSLKRAEVELRQSEEKYRHIFDSALVGIGWISINNGKCLLANSTLARIFGYSTVDEMIRHFILSERLLNASPSSRIVELLQNQHRVERFEQTCLRNDGKTIWLQLSARLDQAQQRLELIAVDITDLKYAEEQARQHELARERFSRLATMGEMAAGLAHQLNQPLTALVNYTAGCVRRLESGSATREELVQVMKQAGDQAQRVGLIIKHLRNFIKPHQPHRGPIDLNQLVAETAEFVLEMEGRHQNIIVEFSPTHDLPPVLADRVQIEQVILNLLRNSVEAIVQSLPDRRTIMVATRLTDRNLVEFSITDTAAMPPPPDIEEMFVPFYTTKKEGMGMGLQICRSIVELHGGRLWAQTNASQGLIFRFNLPTTQENLSPHGHG